MCLELIFEFLGSGNRKNSYQSNLCKSKIQNRYAKHVKILTDIDFNVVLNLTFPPYQYFYLYALLFFCFFEKEE